MRGLPHILNSPCLPWLLAFRAWINFFLLNDRKETYYLWFSAIYQEASMSASFNLLSIPTKCVVIVSTSQMRKEVQRGELSLATFCSGPELPQAATRLHTVLCPSQPPVSPAAAPCPHRSSPRLSSRSLLIVAGEWSAEPTCG